LFRIDCETILSDGPYFSIGVTTFKRRELLVETLRSILIQTISDFEVIVGNDDTTEFLTQDMLGTDDPRVRILNHQVNLGEIGNMNELLAQARGRYFTWLADDDLYAPNFLEAIRSMHERFASVPAVFTGYVAGELRNDEAVSYEGKFQRYSGREFLSKYMTRKVMAIGCYGVFDIQFLRELGGMTQLGQGFSPYSDNFLVIQTALLEYQYYIDAPLIFFRTHTASISYSSADFDAYLSAQEAFCARVLEVFNKPQLREDQQQNLYELLGHWCLAFVFSVLSRAQTHRPEYIHDYLRFLARYWIKLDGFYRVRLMGCVLKHSFIHWVVAPLRTAGQRFAAKVSFGSG
jgi:glycosyltransferase involved in cell wall biosynthesis